MSEDVALAEVHLLGVPLQARARYLQHLDALVRELTLLRIGAQQHPETFLPPRLLQVAAQLHSAYAPFQTRPAAVMEAALAAGEDFCDVTYTVPVTLVPLARGMAEALEEADDFCRREQYLLTLPASQEVVAYRRWLFGEFERQLSGQAPRPWRALPPPPAEDVVPAGPAGTSTAGPGSPATPVWPAGGQDGGQEGGRVPPSPAPAGSGAGAVVGQPVVMESMASSVSAARRHVRRVLTRLGAEDLEESAELGVSELVTNAMLHARTSFTLTVRTMPSGRVRIEVTDSSPLPVQLRHFGVAAPTGRGMQLVASFSSAWGIEELPEEFGPGKTVWFEPKELPTDADCDVAFEAADWAADLGDLL
ncbi:hypothetical protein CLV92_11233 [Kineococcus xinjiangensis]|uniref:Histidine kinase/HSP90-like ATPase domain-containing protein n=1 Tax=Kineococcus xinjiangensis TaxID=512762 RepID=A0A2S6IFD3_9ACTN|nr:ATP-binding protein [Kineococcus xinjiangensis]PPK92860.1 hypothetical protein CLV92_11233 [Kineococcus xinjiangensis]